VALPGEKLSRGAEQVAEDEDLEAGAEEERSAEDGSGRRRRRRRGGRGRGRGGRAGEAADEQVEEEALAAGALPDEVPTLPQHSGFGSVWDSQIGVPADRGSQGPAEPEDELEEVDDEPEVAEYLLAERDKGRRRGRRGGRGGRYGSALDRERFGVGRAGYSRSPGRGRDRAAPAPRASAHSMAPIEQTPGGDPWSEVPPEVQELLMAELARRGEAAPEPATEEAPGAEAEEKPKKRTTRRRTTKKAEDTEAATEEA
jgi:ribonuclease E